MENLLEHQGIDAEGYFIQGQSEQSIIITAGCLDFYLRELAKRLAVLTGSKGEHLKETSERRSYHQDELCRTASYYHFLLTRDLMYERLHS